MSGPAPRHSDWLEIMRGTAGSGAPGTAVLQFDLLLSGPPESAGAEKPAWGTVSGHAVLVKDGRRVVLSPQGVWHGYGGDFERVITLDGEAGHGRTAPFPLKTSLSIVVGRGQGSGSFWCRGERAINVPVKARFTPLDA